MSVKQIKVCGAGGGWTRHIEGSDCSREDEHTLSPAGYLAWHDWAEKQSKTHTQRVCGGCYRWAVWVPKQETAA